jgi:Ca2+-binding RTX toxin-like protein
VDRLGTSASQNLVGGDFKDRLSGVGGDDQLYGNGGSDRLLGGTGDDTLRGGDGADVLVGGRGQDLLVGGAGKNHFLFMSVAESSDIAFDTIADLHKGDVIDLSRIDADASQAGDQAFMRVATFTGHAGELVVSFDTAAVVTSFAGDVDGDGQADLLIQAAGLHDHFAGLVL